MLKKEFGDSIEWGKLYGSVDSDNVYCLAWKDQGLVLFMTTFVDPTRTVMRRRKRPALTATSAATSRRLFDGQPIKTLPIPTFIDMYNHYINGVDVADQLRSYYSTKRTHIKGWKSIWSWLLDVSIINAYRLSRTQPDPPIYRHARQFEFRQQLIVQILQISERIVAKQSTTLPPIGELARPGDAHEHINRGRGNLGLCKACEAAGRSAQESTKRKPLEELSNNTVRNRQRRKRASRTAWACSKCDIPICGSGPCWEEHMEVVHAKTQRLLS